jgi:hypothetical protein
VKHTIVASTSEHANSAYVRRRSGADRDRHGQAHAHCEPRAPQVARELLPHEVDGPQQVDDDVARADAVRELGRRPDQHRADQSLSRPHERHELGGVVARDHAPARRQHGEHHGGAQEAEDRIRHAGGDGRLAIRAVPAEAAGGEREVGAESGTAGHPARVLGDEAGV